MIAPSRRIWRDTGAIMQPRQSELGEDASTHLRISVDGNAGGQPPSPTAPPPAYLEKEEVQVTVPRSFPLHLLEHTTRILGRQFLECIQVFPVRLIHIIGAG